MKKYVKIQSVRNFVDFPVYKYRPASFAVCDIIDLCKKQNAKCNIIRVGDEEAKLCIIGKKEIIQSVINDFVSRNGIAFCIELCHLW